MPNNEQGKLTTSQYNGKLEGIFRRADSEEAKEILEREVDKLSRLPALDSAQESLLQDLVHWAVDFKIQIALPVLNRLLDNDNGTWNAVCVAHLIYSYPKTDDVCSLIDELKEVHSDNIGVMSELGEGLE